MRFVALVALLLGGCRQGVALRGQHDLVTVYSSEGSSTNRIALGYGTLMAWRADDDRAALSLRSGDEARLEILADSRTNDVWIVPKVEGPVDLVFVRHAQEYDRVTFDAVVAPLPIAERVVRVVEDGWIDVPTELDPPRGDFFGRTFSVVPTLDGGLVWSFGRVRVASAGRVRYGVATNGADLTFAVAPLASMTALELTFTHPPVFLGDDAGWRFDGELALSNSEGRWLGRECEITAKAGSHTPASVVYEHTFERDRITIRLPNDNPQTLICTIASLSQEFVLVAR